MKCLKSPKATCVTLKPADEQDTFKDSELVENAEMMANKDRFERLLRFQNCTFA